MTWVFAPKYSLEISQVIPGTTIIDTTWGINTLMSAQYNLSVSEMGQASIQCSDVDGGIFTNVKPQPMDILRLRSTSRFTGALADVWTGYVDNVTKRYDPLSGESVIFTCSSPYKLWNIRRLALSQPGASVPQNDAQSLAFAYMRGISGQNLLKLSAQKVGFPGALGQLTPAAALRFNIVGYREQVEFAGQFSMTLPDGVFTNPDQQTWSSIVQGVVADTANELFTDEDGNLIYRPVGYLNVPANILTIAEADLIQADLSITDTDVATQVRVRWLYDQYSQGSDAVWNAPGGMTRHLGDRIAVVQAPWIRTQPGAQYLANTLGQMYAANVGVGSITIPCNPAIRLGTVIRVPSIRKGAGYGLYYVSGKVGQLAWNNQWVETLVLSYGRAPDQQFPYVGKQSTPVLDSATLTGQDGQLAFGGTGGISVDASGNTVNQFTLFAKSTLTDSQVSVDPQLLDQIPIGSTIYITDANGTSIGSTPHGEYTVVAGVAGQGSASAMPFTLGLRAPGGATSGYITIRFLAPAPDSSSSQAISPNTNPPAGNSQAAGGSGSAVPGPGSSTATGGGAALPTPTTFAYWPIRAGDNQGITQPFGQTPFAGEFPGRGYPHFHTGLDIGAASGVPIIAPCAGVIIQASWDSSGYGNLTILQAGNLNLYFGHQLRFNCAVNDSILAGQTIGFVDSTGNSTGDHLHFGVLDTVAAQDPNTPGYGDGYTAGYVDPALYLTASAIQ